MTPAPRIAGLVLAGGRGTRMGGGVRKPLLDLGGRPMIAHVLARLGPGVAPVMIAADEEAPYAGLGALVLRDRLPDHAGPLAGLDAAVGHLTETGDPATHLLCVPADTPFLPRDLASRLASGDLRHPQVAQCGGRLHFACTLWPLDRLATLDRHLSAGHRSIRSLLDLGPWRGVDFQEAGEDPFANVNTPDDLAAARRRLLQAPEPLVKNP